MVGKMNRIVYQFKVVLRNTHPPIWRRFRVWEDATLGQLHDTLQIVMGWEDCHLHQFEIGQRVYGVPDPDDPFDGPKVIDERRKKLQDVVQRVGMQFDYWYDFGDNWRHDVLLEAILLPESRVQYPRCIAGERSAPPEDVGGPFGYVEYLEAMADPEHEAHEHWFLWRGEFDPESFSLVNVNKHLYKALRAGRKVAGTPLSSHSRPN